LCYSSLVHLVPRRNLYCSFFFFFNFTATTEIYTLSLHDALPISEAKEVAAIQQPATGVGKRAILHTSEHVDKFVGIEQPAAEERSEEHTSELQSLAYLVCRLLLEKKKKKIKHTTQ